MKEKLNNIYSREKFLENQIDEGIVNDFVKKGIEKVRAMFHFTAKKIKGLIAVFDSNGNVLPVVPVQTIIDRFHNNKNINVYASKEIVDDVIVAGGKGCKTTAEFKNDNDYVDETPNDAVAFVNWQDNEYKNTNFYRNLQVLQKRFKEMNESVVVLGDGVLNEAEHVSTPLRPEETISYKNKTEGTGVEEITAINTKEFKKHIQDRIDFYCDDSVDNGESFEPGNMLVFGAPGIGKSTIPNQIVQAYNERQKNNQDRIALISVNCANINSGDLTMPAFPVKKDIMHFLKSNSSEMPELDFVNNMSEEDTNDLMVAINNTKQTFSPSVPKTWLPCFRLTGDEDIDTLLDFVANSSKMFGKTVVKKGTRFLKKTKKVRESFNTGSGGIIVLDEFLRAKPVIFDQLMNFLLDRKLDDDWYLGSKWFIVACSNRPCDDEKSSDGWAGLGSPGRDRWPYMFSLEPDPEDWKQWAQSKGFDEILLNFIFDKEAMYEGRYTRWYRVVSKELAETDSHKPVTPRNWERAFKALINWSIKNTREEEIDGKKVEVVPNFFDMELEDIKSVFGGLFDDSFVSELIQWRDKSSKDIDFDGIISDPLNTIPPRDNEVAVINNLYKIVKQRVEDKSLSDDELTNIIIWLGKWYRNKYAVVASSYITKLETILDNYVEHTKMLMAFLAAFPQRDDIEIMAAKDENMPIDLWSKPTSVSDYYIKDFSDIENILIKDFIEPYFPWRVKNGKIVDIFDFEGNGGKEAILDEDDMDEKNND